MVATQPFKKGGFGYTAGLCSQLGELQSLMEGTAEYGESLGMVRMH